LENALLKHNSHWKSPYKNLQKRDMVELFIQKLHLRQIQVIKGIRRSGKTTVFKLLINHLCLSVNPKSILYVNLDDPYFSELYSDSKNLYKLLELSEKLTNVTVRYLFLDEVQNVSGWEKFTKAIYDNEIVKKIFVTGSNSSLLDGEYATLLSGRFLQDTLNPPSFSELLKFNAIHSRFELIEKKIKALKIVDEMIHFGSFYEVQSESKFKRELILSYYETIIFKDCIANNNLRDTKTFKELVYFIISNSTNLYSYNSIAKATGMNDNTVKQYIGILEDSYILSEIAQYSYSLKEQIKTKKKSYISDNGFLSAVSFKFSNDFGKLFENLVFTELCKRGYEVYFYTKDFECDFICKKEDTLIAIQVCYQLTPQNRQRELNGLKKLPFTLNEKIILTYDQSEERDEDVKIISFWDYFSGL